MKDKIRDLLGSIIMLVFVVSLWVQRDYYTPFGGIFPDIVMVCFVVLIVVMLLLTLTPWSANKNGKDDDEEKGNVSHWFDMAVVGAIMLAWALLLRHLGFVTTSLLGFGGVSWFLNDRRNSPRGLIESFTVGAVMVGVLVLVFEYMLKVPLPKGTIF